jgi:hypothetical protein
LRRNDGSRQRGAYYDIKDGKIMAMDSDVLGMAVAQTLISKSTVPPTPDMTVNIQQVWKDVCKDFVYHIQDNAEVPAGISVSTSAGSGATTGTGKVK